MIKSVISKIKSNIWMFICLIVGSLLITGVLASIPMYSAGTLRQMLSTDMTAYEKKTGNPAGQMYFTGKISNLLVGQSRANKVGEMEETVIGGIDGKTVKIKNYYVQVQSNNMSPLRGSDNFDYSTAWNLSTLSGIEDNITLVEGRMYSDQLTGDGAIEVIVEESEWAENSKVKLGKTYSFTCNDVEFKVCPVGVFKQTDETSVFWYSNKLTFSETLICGRAAYEELMFAKGNENGISQVKIYMNLDFSNASLSNLSVFISYYNSLAKYAKNLGSGRSSLDLNCKGLINSYLRKTTEMEMSLWVLNVPVIAMLAFYMIMVTTMIIEEDRNEISTFKSRGAKTSQIFLRYVVESGIVSVFALIFGPPIGFALAKTVGNASGFMEFDSRDIMPIKLSAEAYIYALIACLFFSALILIPALAATRKTIVNLKQRKARKSNRSWWEKWFVDVACLVVSVGLFFIYKRTNGFNVDGSVDPVVYIISTLFILGCGLLFLRVYPWIVALFFALFKRILRPAPYSAFVQVSRGGNDYRFLMLFLIMTISIGIYSSASARIINNNVVNTINYENGADVVIQPDLSDYSPYDEETGANIPESFRHFSTEKYTDCDYINYVSRVAHYKKNYVLDVDGGFFVNNTVDIMAIDPYEFGNISWCATSLNGIDWNAYLNILEQSPTAVLISTDLAEKANAEVGDVIEVEINGSNEVKGESWPRMKCYVAAIVDYWPTIEASEKFEADYDGDGVVEEYTRSRCFIIMNFEYIWSVRSTTSFQLYMSVTDEAKQGIDSFTEMALDSGIIESADQIVTYRPDIIEDKKSDSMLKGLNGSYSIGFVSTLTVAFVGFLIYWIMNVRKRKLQFGILRAMGLTKGKLTEMLVVEHLLTTGVSVVLGVLIGALTVNVFSPLLKVAYSNTTLPLEIIYSRADIYKIYGVVAAMLLTGIVVLAIFIDKLKINEAVKIGEE